MAVELDPEHVEHLALGEVGPRPQLDHRLHPGGVDRHADLDAHPVDLGHVEQLVEDAEPRLLGQVVDAVEAGQERVALAPSGARGPA